MKFREFIADGWIYRIWMFIIPISLSIILMVANWELAIDAASITPYAWIGTSVIVILLPLSCIACSFLLTPFLMFPLHLLFVRRNGGPFRVGDKVMILSKKNRYVVTNVYSLWQGDSVRVELGDEAQKDFTDVFSQYQLSRA
jgi:hypothetical protein